MHSPPEQEVNWSAATTVLDRLALGYHTPRCQTPQEQETRKCQSQPHSLVVIALTIQEGDATNREQ